ncbi:MAG: FKBP-type peptidyl-prolyl cis-trans isomerase [Clostridia bacterium]|nr:FKBP-type peptidyl-prolyl cis-trans isomerase [Clostridia bacterium]
MKKLVLFAMLILALTVVLCSCGESKTPYDFDLKEYLTIGEFPNVEFDADKLQERLEEEIATVTSEYSTTVDITDRAVKDGDIVNIDYVGKIDGEEFDGGSAEGYDLTIGSNSFIAGFEKGLIDKNIGEEVTLNLVFPEDYGKEDLNGKDVVFTVKINSVKEKTIPAVSDKMIEEKTDYTTVKEFCDAKTKEIARELVWEKYISSATVKKYPKAETKEYYDQIINYYKQLAAYNGVTLETMVATFGGYESVDDFFAYALTSAKSTIKEEMVVYLTVREYDIELSDEDYKKQGEELAVEYGYGNLKEYEQANGKAAIEVNLYTEILIDKMLGEDEVKYEMPETSVETDATEVEGEAEDSSETTDEPAETTEEAAESKAEETTGVAEETTADPDETVA